MGDEQLSRGGSADGISAAAVGRRVAAGTAFGAVCGGGEGLFVKVLLPARERGVVKLGTVALGEAKMHATASRHSALSYEHAG